MNKLNINAIALAVTLAFSAGAMAEGMSKADYKAGKDKISATYKTDKAACSSLSGNAGDICKAEALGKEKVGAAELDASYQPTSKNRYQARVAKADADYGVAKEKCDDLAGNAKDVCVKEAKAVETKALADAKMSKQIGEAKKEASEDKSDANYKVAVEKCDAMTGDPKASCVAAAKVKFGKS